MLIKANPAVNPLAILVIGGGISGLLSAILQERNGHRVTLIEKSDEWKPVGGGITLTLNGVRLLKSLGFMPQIERCANEIRTITIADRVGRTLSSFHLDDYAASYAKTVTIFRPHLHQILLNGLTTTHVQLGTGFRAIEQLPDQAAVTFTDGTTGRYDLVLGCDGINSAVRSALFPTATIKYAGYSSWRFVAPDVGDLDYSTVTEMWSTGQRFGIVPLTENRVHCFASVNTGKNSVENRGISVPAFRKIFSGFGGYVPQLMATLKQSSDLIYNDLEDVHVKKWYKGRVLLMGDAAHGMTPNMTQGASLAIEDAWVLATQLARCATPETALSAFYNARKKRVNAIQRKSNLLGKIGQISTPALCNLRNYCWKRIPDRWIQNDLKKLLAYQEL
ncbi:FAD-dependent monooxygenase [Larkinella ripae]